MPPGRRTLLPVEFRQLYGLMLAHGEIELWEWDRGVCPPGFHYIGEGITLCSRPLLARSLFTLELLMENPGPTRQLCEELRVLISAENTFRSLMLSRLSAGTEENGELEL